MPDEDEVFMGDEVPQDDLDRLMEILLPLVQAESLTQEQWTAASTALREFSGNKDLETPLKALKALALKPDNAEVLKYLRQWLDASRPLQTHTWGGEQPPARRWLVQKWLPAERVALCVGPGQIGKSRLALQLAAGIATGGDGEGGWIGAPLDTLRLGEAVEPEGNPVVFASWEDEFDEFDRRISQIASHPKNINWISPKGVKNIVYVDMAGEGPLWAPGGGGSGHISTLATLTPAGARIRALVERVHAKILILDPLAAVYAGDENARGLVRAFISDWDAWGRANDCAVFLIAHPPKYAQDNDDEDFYSGNTDWHSAVRCLWTLRKQKVGDQPKGKRATDNRREAWKLSLAKGNYGEEPEEPLELIWDKAGPGQGPIWRTKPWGDSREVENAHNPSTD